ncbi:MAG: hypothetical protein WC444_04290 [Candidatus Paceibacterota bacterium]
MPRWQKLCKPGEQPSEFYDNKEFERRFNIKSGFGPLDETGQMRWNRCWSCLPKEWERGVDWLLAKIRFKYRLETLEDPENSSEVQVIVSQAKDKYGSLRFYFDLQNLDNYEEAYKEIEGWIDECEKMLKEDDLYYGIPY